MGKKSKQIEKNASDYYKLKTGAVDKLVNAKDAPVVPEKEISKFKSAAGKIKLPAWLKAVFVKFWFGGAACYFFFWGLSMYIGSLESIFLLGFGLGVVTDIMVNNVLRFLAPQVGDHDKYMMFPMKKFWTIFLNVLYGWLIVFCIVQFYELVNGIIIENKLSGKQVPLGVEPLLFGTLYMAFDSLFILIKNTFKKIFKDAINANSRPK